MNEISGARCLVTGGAGFIGSTIVDLLLKGGASEVVVIDNFVRGNPKNIEAALTHSNFKLVKGDICDATLVDELTAGIDFIFHQAALRITRCAEFPREAVDVLIKGTLNVLEAAVHHKVKKVVAASSASVYGEPSYLPMDENHPFNNRTMYGAGKIADEQILRAYHTSYGLNYIAFRPFNVYGPRMDVTGAYTEVLIRWLDAIEANRPPLIFGDGTQSMDFVFVGDVARANLLAAQSEITDDVFNVGTGIQTSLNQLCDMLLSLTGSSQRPEHREARAVANVQRRRAGVEKAAKLLGFEARVPLAEGMKELIRWRHILNAEPVVMEAL